MVPTGKWYRRSIRFPGHRDRVSRRARYGLRHAAHARVRLPRDPPLPRGAHRLPVWRCLLFLAPGDLAIVQRSAAAAPARFPTGHYHGITVSIDPARAPDCLSCFLEDVEVRPSALIEKFCADAACFVTRSSQGVAHIFSELYSVPEGIRKGYFKVKILELLLFLSAFPMQAAQPQHSYPQSQVQLAEQVGAYLLENTERRLTVAELAQRFGASVTLINSSFRGVYGMSPAAFLRAQKCTAQPASCARPTAQCWILPASLGMIMAASSPKRSGTSSASRPMPTAAASTATAARQRLRRSDGGADIFFILEPCSDDLERMPGVSCSIITPESNETRSFSHMS